MIRIGRIEAYLHRAEIREAAVPRLAERGLGWIEEPIAADSPAADWTELAILSRVPLAGGENIAGFPAFANMIEAGSHGVVQPDALRWGGVTGALAVAGGPGLLEHDVMENP